MSVGTSRGDAWGLVCEWTQSDSLRRHMLAVEAAMRAYAPRFEGDPDLTTGHPRYAMAELRERGYPEELIRAVGSHADFLGISRETPMEKALFAVDELCGFVLAVAYVRPEGLAGMTAKSVKKKMKQPSFAAAVNRDELLAGAAGLGVEFDEHVETVIAALAASAGELLPAG
jgi:predicted hydrolase (HD superfamily)